MNSTIPSIKTIGFLTCLFFFQAILAQNTSSIDEENTTSSTGELNISTENSTDPRPKIRLRFTSVGIINREILLTIDDRCTDGYDWGFDGHLNDVQVDDMSWLIDDELFVIQGIGDIDTEETSLPLSIQKSDVGDVVIAIQALENFPNDIDIILHDTELDTYYDLKNANYEATLSAGIYEDRFVIGFQNPSGLSIDDNEENQLEFYYETNSDKLVVLNPTNSILTNIEVYNISGQLVYNIKDVIDNTHSEYRIDNLTSGTYIVRINTNDYKVITKKIIVN
ncbi:T9SS type A sorting domain-containing protein [Winogradskyella algicola]|uniref:T9SS type A sorting domain-containing protein n=1 Tax=Winogradskyella algicola TaxID=2575815 RepID=UPI0011099CC4|nr:T9SS type A sorting domain-containing protein [Winogradskyella algicola]